MGKTITPPLRPRPPSLLFWHPKFLLSLEIKQKAPAQNRGLFAAVSS